MGHKTNAKDELDCAEKPENIQLLQNTLSTLNNSVNVTLSSAYNIKS